MQLVLERNFSVGEVLIKHLIFILGNFAFVTIPYGLKIIDEVSVQLHWEFVKD